MSFFSSFYYQKLADNEKNIRFWDDYLQNLKALDFDIYADKLRVPILVPIGSRIFFKGELKHTNEVTVALGADYFAKCSVKQAEVLRQHRIKDAQSKLETFQKEKEYLENQLTFTKQNVYEREGQEIVEFYTEEEDKAWREKHRDNVRNYKQRESKTRDKGETEITDEELWNRLEELELQEELENELANMNKDDGVLETKADKESFVIKEEDIVTKKNPANVERLEASKLLNENNLKTSSGVANKKETYTDNNRVTPKYELLQKVIDKQYELEEKLIELRNTERSPSKTEKDLISKLDEMERLDELEDELDRLDDIIETEDAKDSEEESTCTTPTIIKRKVSFADEDDSETLELSFTHTDVEPCKKPYDAKTGIIKPSDIYEAFANSFSGEATSILKKSKYKQETSYVEVTPVKSNPKVGFEEYEDNVEVNRTIEIKDVIEKVVQSDNNKLESGSRPTSLFKKKRQQMKS